MKINKSFGWNRSPVVLVVHVVRMAQIGVQFLLEFSVLFFQAVFFGLFVGEFAPILLQDEP